MYIIFSKTLKLKVPTANTLMEIFMLKLFCLLVSDVSYSFLSNAHTSKPICSTEDQPTLNIH